MSCTGTGAGRVSSKPNETNNLGKRETETGCSSRDQRAPPHRRRSLEGLSAAREQNLEELRTMYPDGDTVNFRLDATGASSPCLLMDNGSAKNFQTFETIPLDD